MAGCTLKFETGGVAVMTVSETSYNGQMISPNMSIIQSTLRHRFTWKIGNDIHDVVSWSRYLFLRNYSQRVVDKSCGLLNIHKSRYVHATATNMLIILERQQCLYKHKYTQEQ